MQFFKVITAVAVLVLANGLAVVASPVPDSGAIARDAEAEPCSRYAPCW
ncbi:hypothetical protein EST38_g2552 [Candolleomyces aberdarensis]|uniref:Uncharacterized protein n=1 Tax=Candolleomyces aberdarensis TaxID=2316362 RepID=A0A4Q2DVB4_9AGAR|nr:hypothetical protein EST38_g2552 [Candolleomyces aberdarensis]